MFAYNLKDAFIAEFSEKQKAHEQAEGCEFSLP